MNALAAHGIESVFHYAPLHYLLFIARSKALLAKTEPDWISIGFEKTKLYAQHSGPSELTPRAG